MPNIRDASSTSPHDLRRSVDGAGSVLTALLPKAGRKAVLEIVADSIRRAHQLRPDRWGVRVSPDSVMLKVGRIEVIQILPSYFHVVLDGGKLPQSARKSRGLEFSEAELYRSVPGSQGCDMAISLVTKVWPTLEVSHRALIAKAATTGRHSTTVVSHSPGVIQFLARELNRRVPQPAYLSVGPGDTAALPEEVPENEEYVEGAVSQVLVNRFERDPKARAACVAHHGTRCAACGVALSEVYGPAAVGLVHVHHLVPLSEVGDSKAVNPMRDMRPVCPNCHAVIHSRKPAWSIEEIEAMVAKCRGA